MIADHARLYRLAVGTHSVATAPYRRARCRWRLWRGVDPMIAVLDAAPWDDEPLTAEERRQIEESERGIAEGRPLLATPGATPQSSAKLSSRP
jgi:hypothetical protein